MSCFCAGLKFSGSGMCANSGIAEWVRYKSNWLYSNTNTVHDNPQFLLKDPEDQDSIFVVSEVENPKNWLVCHRGTFGIFPVYWCHRYGIHITPPEGRKFAIFLGCFCFSSSRVSKMVVGQNSKWMHAISPLHFDLQYNLKPYFNTVNIGYNVPFLCGTRVDFPCKILRL